MAHDESPMKWHKTAPLQLTRFAASSAELLFSAFCTGHFQVAILAIPTNSLLLRHSEWSLRGGEES